jgi:hypothetical protein
LDAAGSPKDCDCTSLLTGPGKQIPRRLKPVRDDKNKDFSTAQLKLLPFKPAQAANC